MIDTIKFYRFGIVIFILIGLFQIGNIAVTWAKVTVFGNITNLLYSFFSFLTAGFFYYLYKIQKSVPNLAQFESSDEDLLKALKESK